VPSWRIALTFTIVGAVAVLFVGDRLPVVIAALGGTYQDAARFLLTLEAALKSMASV
jgi:hypothetical protein